MMRPEKYCKKIVGRSKSNFYYSFFFLPRRKRRAIRAVYAFSRTIDDIADGDCDLTAKERMFSFWRGEIEQAYSGRSDHPLTREIVYAIRGFGIPKEYLADHLSGVMQDVIQRRYATFEDLKKYCYRVASVVGLMCLKIFEVKDSENNKKAATDLGLALQLINILRDVGEDAEHDRIYLPEEDLIQFGLTEADILGKTYSDEFVRLMSFEWDRARGIFDGAIAGFDKPSARRLLPAMIMADIYYQILMRIREINYNVFEHRLSIPNLRKIVIALRRWLAR